jgi:hypothetical protein
VEDGPTNEWERTYLASIEAEQARQQDSEAARRSARDELRTLGDFTDFTQAIGLWVVLAALELAFAARVLGVSWPVALAVVFGATALVAAAVLIARVVKRLRPQRAQWELRPALGPRDRKESP